MKKILSLLPVAIWLAGCATAPTAPKLRLEQNANASTLVVPAEKSELRLSDIYFETAQGRVAVPSLTVNPGAGGGLEARAKATDGRAVTLTVKPAANRASPALSVQLSAVPADGITKWGFAVDANADEYFTGLMERVVDGPQAASWAPGIQQAMNLRGQKVEMLVKSTTSVYAPFYLSSRG